IRAIDVLLESAANGWTRAGLVEIGCQPYLNTGIDPTVVNYIGFRRRVAGLSDWELALRRLERECREREERLAAGEELDERGTPPPPSDVVVATRESFGAFASIARALDGQRTIQGWVEWLRAALDRDAFRVRVNAHALAQDRFDVVRRDLAALDGVQEILNEWGEALSALPASSQGKVVAVADFQKELRAFLSGDAAIWTLAREGVHVLEGSAAAYRTFDHVFLVGLQASAFPAPAPQSFILDETEREELARAGLPLDTHAVWDEREQELFRVLTAGARKSLTLSYSRLDELGRDVIPSSFVEAVKDVAECALIEIPTSKVTIEGVPLYSLPESLDQAVHGAAIERLRAMNELSLYNGLVQSADLLDFLATHFGDDKIWSPTQLEEFAKCPWAYFSKRLLTVEKLDDPDEDIDPATRGSVLHLALRHFYDAARVRAGGPVFLRAVDLEWAREMMAAALDRALAESAWRWLGHPVLQPAHRAEFLRLLRDFIEWEAELHEEMHDPKKWKKVKMVRTGADQHEVAFEDMSFEKDGVRIRYRGSIDRVDVSVDDRAPGVGFVAAIDYKTTKYSTPGSGKPGAWDDGVVLQVPLYAHALRTLRPGQDIARVEYQTLKGRPPERVHSLELYTIDKSRRVEEDADAEAKWQAALDHAIAHVRRARSGEFPAKPPESCNCPPWCHGRDICRIPGGPKNGA
ncbi:MAG TPA: PD-(D/E)XK nuclease family protein, partial [Gemmatimonadaceae bacterium]